MELHTEVLIHNETMTMKGVRGVLLQISPDGYYEVNCIFGERFHRTLFPIPGTVLISLEPEERTAPVMEIER